jgi:hypothetical protein
MQRKQALFCGPTSINTRANEFVIGLMGSVLAADTIATKYPLAKLGPASTHSVVEREGGAITLVSELSQEH